MCWNNDNGARQAALSGILGMYGKNASCDSHNKISYSNLRGVESRFLSVDSPTSWGRMPKRFDRDLRKAGMKVILLENRNREQ